MIAATIGRKFLVQYNQQRGRDLSPKEFFETIFLPLFYGHSKPMMIGGNTALSNPSNAKDLPEVKFGKLIAHIDAGYLDTRTTLDFPSVEPVTEKDVFNTTSGQTTDLKIAHKSDTAFCSWIGNGMSVGIGGVNVLFDHPVILEAIFEGWKHYRDYLNEPIYSELPGRKIHAWNATWLNHYFGKYYQSAKPLAGFKPINSDKKGSMTVKGGFWANPLFMIARKIPSESIMGYVFQIASTNQTYGFIRFDLPEVKRLPEFYKVLFGEYADQRDTNEVENLYGNNEAFLLACERGVVGVAALQPAGLWQFAYPETAKGAKKNSGWVDYDPKNSTSKFTFNTYQSWLMAMLKRNDYWDEANKAADLLRAYEKGADAARTDRKNEVIKILGAKTQSAFLEELTPVLKSFDLSLVEPLVAVAKEVHELSPESFMYFRVLIKFRYVERVKMEQKERN